MVQFLLPAAFLVSRFLTIFLILSVRCLIASALILALMSPTGYAACVADSQKGSESVDQLINDIIRDEIALEKFNLRFSLEAVKQGRWKGLRYGGLQEANNALSDAGLIVGTAERFQHISNPRKNHNGALMHANVLPAIGQTIGAGASCLELVINGLHSMRARQLGFAPGHSRRYATRVIADLDDKLAQLEALCQSEPGRSDSGVGKLHELERRVLTDMRNVSVAEFKLYFLGSRKAFWTQQSFYMLDCAKNTVGAVGNLVGYNALRHHNSKLITPLGTLVTISGAMIVLDPVLSRAFGRSVELIDRHLLSKTNIGEIKFSCEELHNDTANLHAFCERSKIAERRDQLLESAIDRAAVYESADAHVMDQMERGARDIRKGNRQALQNICAATLTGSTKLTAGIETLVAGAAYLDNPRRINVLLGSGTLTYMAGLSFTVIDQMRILAAGQLKYHKLKKRGELPAQLARARLEELEKMEQSLEPI